MSQTNKKLFGYFPLTLILGAFLIMASPSKASEIEDVFKKNGVVPDVVQTAPAELLQVFTSFKRIKFYKLTNFLSILLIELIYKGGL